jgi:RNA-directed DNA polymerase
MLDRVCQQALVQRMEPIVAPTILDSSFEYCQGHSPHEYCQGHSPHDAMRKVWRELNAGYGWIVDADLRQFFGASG